MSEAIVYENDRAVLCMAMLGMSGEYGHSCVSHHGKSSYGSAGGSLAGRLTV